MSYSGDSFDPKMLEALVCPRTHGNLTYDPDRQELISPTIGLAFPIRSGIPILLLDEARDLSVDS